MVSLSKKVCLLGDFAVGKTSLVRRLVHDLFDDRYISTIGVKVSRKTLTIARDHAIIDLSIILWDLAGSEEFTHMRASYLRGASGLFLVGDLTRPATITNLHSYMADLTDNGQRIPMVIAANKLDLVNTGEEPGVIGVAQSVATHLEAPLFFTSALTGNEVEQAFHHLGRLMV